MAGLYHVDNPVTIKVSKITTRIEVLYMGVIFALMLLMFAIVEVSPETFILWLLIECILFLLLLYFVFQFVRHKTMHIVYGEFQSEYHALLHERVDIVREASFRVEFKQRKNLYDYYSILVTVWDKDNKKVFKKMPISYFDYKKLKEYYTHCEGCMIEEMLMIRGGNKE